MSFCIIANPEKYSIQDPLERVIKWCQAKGTEVFVTQKLQKHFPKIIIGNTISVLENEHKAVKAADIDKDGHLDEEEFALAMYLIEVKIKDDDEIPSALPEHLVPPGKRRLVFGAAHGN